MIKLQNVLVATDFSEPSETALTYGRDFARAFGARLHVLHVVDSLSARTTAGESYAMDLAGLQRQVEERARERLETLVREDDRRELGAVPVLRTSSSPALAIVEYAKEAGIDLIVVGTHGRSGVSHLLMGSVAERVVRTAPCPVLAVRHPQHEFVLPDALQAVVRS